MIGIYDGHIHSEVPRAYIVPVEGKDSKEDAEEIIKWIAGKVANHKRLRGGIRFIEEVPKSASGKILRRVLKEKAKAEEESKPAKAKL